MVGEELTCLCFRFKSIVGIGVGAGAFVLAKFAVSLILVIRPDPTLKDCRVV